MNKGLSHTRSLPLDVFRGLVIATMILVNAQGDYHHAFSPFMHVGWNGLHLADCVFPFFVFVMGVSIAYALDNKSALNMNSVEYQITKRTLKLFMLGLALNAIPNYYFPQYDLSYLNYLSVLRFMGVLQRLAIVYFIVSLLFLNTTERQRYVFMLLILVVYSVVLAYCPYPIDSHGQTIWTYGHLVKYNNVIAYIDNAILGREHLLYYGTPLAEDPEGLFSTLPSLFNAIAGVQMGRWLKTNSPPSHASSIKALVCGLGLILLGYAFSFLMPINKSLWTVPFTLITTGLAIMVFMACILGVERLSKDNILLKPFVILGVNSLAFYFLSSALLRLSFAVPIANRSLHAVCFDVFKRNFHSIQWASMWFAICFWLLCFIPMVILYRKKIFIKV